MYSAACDDEHRNSMNHCHSETRQSRDEKQRPTTIINNHQQSTTIITTTIIRSNNHLNNNHHTHINISICIHSLCSSKRPTSEDRAHNSLTRRILSTPQQPHAAATYDHILLVQPCVRTVTYILSIVRSHFFHGNAKNEQSFVEDDQICWMVHVCFLSID